MSGIRNNFVLQDGDLIVHRTNPDVEPTLRYIKGKRDAGAWDTKDGSMRHVGTVDTVLMEAMLLQHGVTLRQFYMDETLQDKFMVMYFAEYPAFKVHPGRNL